jgi:hypothetical protein
MPVVLWARGRHGNSGLTKGSDLLVQLPHPRFKPAAESEEYAFEEECGMVARSYARTIEIDHVVSLELGRLQRHRERLSRTGGGCRELSRRGQVGEPAARDRLCRADHLAAARTASRVTGRRSTAAASPPTPDPDDSDPARRGALESPFARPGASAPNPIRFSRPRLGLFGLGGDCPFGGGGLDEWVEHDCLKCR